MKRILIANRGEIAVRVMRTAHAMGFETVAVYSEPDRTAPHVKAATYAIALGGQSAVESYLDQDKIIEACKASGADSVHPGYGFLSERAPFARALHEHGLTFIGPPADAIVSMGSKSESKRLMIDAGVPCVPGYHGEAQGDDVLVDEAARVGYPVMVKASAGGGGKGMRLVMQPEGLREALRSARSEALNAFGDDKLLLERAILEPRHIEIQVFADQHGHVIHLGERDCSVQRRHQKVIEEAPGVGITAELRARMGDAAVAAATAIGYEGAGTVEFLLLPDGETFYFLEMNTRLQVEHPVTEMITGLDLVKWQLIVAQGEPLPLAQDDVKLQGHAIEVRVYAEDPYDGFLPQSGVLARWQPAEVANGRVDSGVVSGQEISTFYDPMLAKMIVFGEDRAQARRGLVRMLEQSVALGTRTNMGFLLACLTHEDFVQGGCSTRFIHDAFGELERAPLDAWQKALTAALWVEEHARRSKWGAWRGWSSTGERRSVAKFAMSDGQTVHFDVSWQPGGVHTVTWVESGERVEQEIGVAYDEARACWVVQRTGTRAYVHVGSACELWVSVRGETWMVEEQYSKVEQAQEGADGVIRAPMAGKILSVRVEPGASVQQGDIVMVLEAMKMEHELTAAVSGKVEALYVEEGAQVQSKSMLVEIV